MKFLLDHDVPDNLSYLLQQLNHDVSLLRHVLPQASSDSAVLSFAHEQGCLLVTCNRDDSVRLAKEQPHQGIVVIIRRTTRAAERAALFRRLERAGASGLRDNVNFAVVIVR